MDSATSAIGGLSAAGPEAGDESAECTLLNA